MERSLFHKFLFLFVIFTFIGSGSLKAAIGDSVLNGLRLETKVHYGSVFPHHSGVTYILDKNILGAEITLSTESKDRHMWENLFRYPRYGLGYSFLNLGNAEVLGNMHALYTFMDVPFYTPKNSFSFNYQLDIGLAYFTKSYHPYENPLNHAVSSPVTIYLGVDLIGRFKVGEKNELKTSLELTHCSNGKTRTPNLGINIITFSAAWLYSLKPMTPTKAVVNTSGYKKHFIEFIGNVGGKRDDNMREEVFLVSSLIADYHYSLSPKYAVGMGFDAFYDASLLQNREFNEGGEYDESMNYQYGAHIGFRGRYGRLNMLINVGHYIAYDYLRHGTMYTRLGLRYALTETILLNLTLKAHSTIADYIEWGVGYRINTKGK